MEESNKREINVKMAALKGLVYKKVRSPSSHGDRREEMEDTDFLQRCSRGLAIVAIFSHFDSLLAWTDNAPNLIY